ncbi:hypothetical protein [Aquimarina agarivorans]|uniref:hypothetical protein n=1 Tax=Aquimarina agarivorans TaxID=980584 RepID=UPI000248F8D0|nr:hypothetical protein [Aquimarina agarivorans]
MIKNFTLHLFLFLSLISFSQKKSHTVEIKIKEPIVDFGYNVVKVIDNRLVKTNIGFAQKGMFNKRFPAILPESFEPYMLKILQTLIPNKETSKDLILVFNELNVSEHTKATAEIGRARIQIEFLKSKEDQLILIGEAEAQIESKGLDVTKKHGIRILKGIVACIEQSKKEMDYDSEGIVYNFDQKTDFDFTKIPQKGLYASFNKLALGDTIDLGKKYQLQKKGTKTYPKYFLKDENNKRIKKRMMAISDGESIYIHASRYSYDFHYTKSKEIGRYIYFEDKFTDPVAAAVFGLMGAAMSNVGRAIVLDTKTGLVKILNEKTINEIVQDFSEIKKDYNNSNRNIKNKRELIVRLNEKFK